MTPDSKKALWIALAVAGSAIVAALVVFAVVDYSQGQELFALAYSQEY